PENAKFVYDNGVYFASRLIKKQLPVLKTFKYLQRQKERYPDNRHRIGESDYFDYLNMCEKLGLDTTKQSVLYPKDFVKRHDEAVKQQKFKESKVLNEKFALRKPFLDNFFFKSDGLFIRAAETQKDLIIEGKILHHCVANYADRHADGETTIFLVRKVTEPDSPFFTLEFDFDNQTVKQNRGMRNCARTNEVKAFERKWLNFVTKKIKELEKNGTKRNNPAA
ncbi:MAG: PcfJ domain-containing protein, partial [Clostridia bacterium]|nr:PcfJ domain-containing protein [Clostridia bacterium]